MAGRRRRAWRPVCVTQTRASPRGLGQWGSARDFKGEAGQWPEARLLGSVASGRLRGQPGPCTCRTPSLPAGLTGVPGLGQHCPECGRPSVRWSWGGGTGRPAPGVRPPGPGVQQDTLRGGHWREAAGSVWAALGIVWGLRGQELQVGIRCFVETKTGLPSCRQKRKQPCPVPGHLRPLGCPLPPAGFPRLCPAPPTHQVPTFQTPISPWRKPANTWRRRESQGQEARVCALRV